MSKRVTNSQFGMFEFFHILGFGHPYNLRHIVLNLEIFDRRIDRDIVRYRPCPNPPYTLNLKKIALRALTWSKPK